ncbi:SLAC1 anion channel family protein [Alkalitalea saponilacus]|uniref:Tellurite resistance protein n=1 Tax=Alkalitalea saponilacus TaxID=889453 RepID=A0A1T5G725_9BACT|nr:SLAC1 anion channel family protein [Alkalitalea saponilacus]SKC04134.1 tellurite resistance protein [Alkalitalea saponilacus]
MKDKIKYFPITAYTVIMGLSGLTLIFSKYGQLGWLPDTFYNVALWAVSSLFVAISIMYLLKRVMFPEEVMAEYRHPIRINFFPTISISLLLLSIAFEGYNKTVSAWLWWPGVALQTWFALNAISYWIQHNYQIQHFNPAWFIPAVGNVLVPVSGIEHAPMIISYFYFSSGMFFWIVLFVIFLYRVVFHGQLAEKFIPTFFILIAPPAVGFISYMKFFPSWDGFSMFMLMMALFFVLLLAKMGKSFTKLRFFMSWWAFTFPMTAITVATALAWEMTGIHEFKYISWALGAMAAVIISIVAYKTIAHMRKGEICVMEE